MTRDDEPHHRLRLGAVHQRRVGPDDVGSRVSVRRLVPDEGGRRVPSDVLGHLRAWEDDRLLIVTRSGDEVEVPADDVVASRVVPDPPPRRR